jgi:DNA-binding transcriptional ArsR family regulator
VTGLRAMAHPVRLQILSLLTGSAMSAAEVARELSLTHANASYHLRLLAEAGLLTDAGEERIRGGRAKRYRHEVEAPRHTPSDAGSEALFYRAMADELVRRAARRRQVEGRGMSTDADLWVPPDVWARAVDRMTEAVRELHHAAEPVRSTDAVHVSVTAALFELDTP